MNDLLQTWNDPHARHAMIVHWPIVLGMLTPVMMLLVALTRGRNRTLAWLTLACAAGVTVGAFMAADSGEHAVDSIEMRFSPISAAEGNAVEDHEHRGQDIWKWSLCPLLFTALATVPWRKPAVRWVVIALALLFTTGTAVNIGATAHAGGKILYEHGLGVPERGKAAAVDSARNPDDHEHDDR